MKTSICIDQENNKPCIKDTNFKIAKLMSEIACGYDIHEISENFNLDCDIVKKVLMELAMKFDKPYMEIIRRENR